MRRLFLRYGLAMTSVVLIAFLVPLGLVARSVAADGAVDAGRRDSERVALLAGGAGSLARLEAEVLLVNTGDRRTTVYLPDGTVVGPDVPRGPAVELAERGRAFSARTVGGVEVLKPVASADGIAVVRTLVADHLLRQGVLRSWLLLGGVGLLLLGATALVGDRIAARLAASAGDLARTAGRLGAGDLSARVVPSGPPEIEGAGRVLNQLGARIEDLLAAERELIADLSHRLRTPVTALRLDADGLADAGERAQMQQHVEELVAAVDAVVRAAREPGGPRRCATPSRWCAPEPPSGPSSRPTRAGPCSWISPRRRCPSRSPPTTWAPPWTCCWTTCSRTPPQGWASR